MDQILYLDLCNEWPGNLWAPFFENDPPDAGWSAWNTKASMDYMRRAVECIREQFPEIPLCFSMDNITMDHYKQNHLDFFDLIEHHIWMAKLNNNEFYNCVGNAKNGRFSEEPYHLLAKHAYHVYSERPDYWKALLKQGIRDLAQVSAEQGLPLATTECWGIVDYKDYPMLRWDWVQELCKLGVETALQTGRWVMAATSNFAAPQFVGMWRDVEWHRSLTGQMKQTALDEHLVNDRLKKTAAASLMGETEPDARRPADGGLWTKGARDLMSKNQSLGRTTLQQAAIDPNGVQDFIDACLQNGSELHQLMIIRDGKVAFEGCSDPYQPQDRRHVYSISKSWTATAVGFAIAEGTAVPDRSGGVLLPG